MANEEHLTILYQGIEAWNQWRQENPYVKADLSRADLSGMHLSEADLHEADLSEANLDRADLSHANLSKVDLNGAHLSEAILREVKLGEAKLLWGANLRKADLCGADLSGAALAEAYLNEADLSRANLIRADLTSTNLKEANLRMAYLCEAYLGWADLSGADLSGADLRMAYLREANLDGADLSHANLRGANLRMANLSKAGLREADFTLADLIGANFSMANLICANLEGASLVETNFTKADLTNCRIYGISAWDLKLTDTIQKDLIVTHENQPTITVDNLEVAQFIYLLLQNEKVRQVIDTITSKAVLILGRFTPERKAVLDALRTELRKHDFTPILFDFDKPTSRNLTETVSTLAHMARFVIADLTDAKSIPQELQRIVPELPSLPVQPIILASQYEYSMFIDLRDYPWVLPIYRYADTDALLTRLDASVIAPALTKAEEIAERRKALEEEMAKERKS